MNGAPFTLDEILSQPQVWATTLAGLDLAALRSTWHAWQPTGVVVTGCGSTHYLAMSAAALLRGAADLHAVALPASDIALAPTLSLPTPTRTVLIAISRSGTTSETIAAVERYRAAGGCGVVTITCEPGSPLAAAADVTLAAPAARERSIAQTRSFSSMLVIAQAVAAALGGFDTAALAGLPDACSATIRTHRAAMTALARRSDIERFFLLGSGALHGVAAEGMLKLKEMSLTASEAYHVLEFRHGPMSMVDAHAAVIGLISPDRSAPEEAVLTEMATLGAHVVALGDDAGAFPWWARPALALPSLQILAYERAVARELDPDQPRNLSAVVELEGI